jgi:nucleoside-diphosphate-sugar epimerase
MKVLVAGGAGFIGSVLVPMLQERGYEVQVADLLWFGNHLPASVEVHKRDIFTMPRDFIAGFDAIIFLAGLSNDPMAEFSPAMNFIDNAALPTYLAYEAKQAGVKKFVYASSCSVYGYTVDKLYDETSPVTCPYPYGISKLLGERGVLSLGDSKFSTIALRQGTVCGYSPRQRFDLIINAMFKSAITTGKIVVNNPGIWRPILDVRDTASAFIRALQANPSIQGVFNVAYDNFTVGQVADLVKDRVDHLTGLDVQIQIKDIHDLRNYKVSSSKAQTELGFSPRWSIDDMIDSLYEHSNEFGDYSYESYYNIQVFKKLALADARSIKESR